MNSFIVILALLSLAKSRVVERFTTNQRQVYAWWSECDSCQCDYYSVSAYEQDNQAQNNPPFNLNYWHYSSNSCTNNWYYEDLFNTNQNLMELSILRSGRSADLTANDLTDSANNQISINLSWSGQNSQNSQDNKCDYRQDYGTQTIKIKSDNGYKQAKISGSITVGGVVHTPPEDSYGYIYNYGLKEFIYEHN